MKHIVFDCDNTFGIPNCDVDDGLALVYLLGSKEAVLHGITATYGNNKIDVVYPVIQKMLRDLGREEITVKRGGAAAGDYKNEAGDYLVEMANKYENELSVLATGSLTNLMSAYRKDSQFFEKVKEIVLMGGITEPLVFEKKIMKELNFSCDPQASAVVLSKGKNVSVVTGNNCLKVLFTRSEYKEQLFMAESKIARYIREKTDYWFGYNEEDYGIGGFYNWDVTAAVYMMHPELFIDCMNGFQINGEDMKTGFLRRSEQCSSMLNLPEIGKSSLFKQNIYDTWLSVDMP